MHPAETSDSLPLSDPSTPYDYSDDIYQIYFEVIDHETIAKGVILEFFGSEHACNLVTVKYGYLFNAPIQCIPDLIRLLVNKNIAIYQVKRLTKVVV